MAEALITWEELLLTMDPNNELDETDRAFGETLIEAISARANQITKRKLASRTYTEEVLDGEGGTMLVLPEYPVTTVTSLYIDTARTFGSDTLQTADDDYYLYSGSGKIFVPAGIPTARQCIQITYTAGLVTVPGNLKEAVVLAFAYIWKQRSSRSLGTRSITADGVTTQYEIDIPMSAMRTFESFRRIV